MQSKIACTAGKLSLLQPDMIQKIVAEVAYKTGAQYASENRVRLVSSDEARLVSSVTGNYWMHEQDIRLKDGWLVANCSCRVEEQPLCRHGIAALLAYQSALPAEQDMARQEFARSANKPLKPDGSAKEGMGKKDRQSDRFSDKEKDRERDKDKGRRAAVILEAQVVGSVSVVEPVVMGYASGNGGGGPARRAQVPQAAAARTGPAGELARADPEPAPESAQPAHETAKVTPMPATASPSQVPQASVPATTSSAVSAPTRDLKFSEIAMFIEWLQPAVESLKQGNSMPGLPGHMQGEPEEWVRTLLTLQGQLTQAEEAGQALRSEVAGLKTALSDRNAQYERVNQQWQDSQREAREAQATCVELQASLKQCQVIIRGLQDLGRQLDQCEGQIREMGEELARKKSQHDLLSGSFRDIAAALRPLGKAAEAIAG